MILKEKPKVEKKETVEIETIKEDIVLEEKIKTPIKLEKEKKIILDEKIESLPTKKIKPKIKPKPIKQSNVDEKKSDLIIKAQPKPKPQPEFSIASMLKDLRNEKSSRKEINEEKKENISEEKNAV